MRVVFKLKWQNSAIVFIVQSEIKEALNRKWLESFSISLLLLSLSLIKLVQIFPRLSSVFYIEKPIKNIIKVADRSIDCQGGWIC